jgi:hypothetical protein
MQAGAEAVTRKRRAPGQTTLWAPVTRPYCYACRGVMRATIADHVSSRAHRNAVTPRREAPAYDVGPERHAWRVAIRRDNEGTARQNAAAMRRLERMT